MKRLLPTLLFLFISTIVFPQVYNQIDEFGNVSQREEYPGQNNQTAQNQNFNKHNRDTTKRNREIPKGMYVWTIDRKFGDIRKAEIDTMPHLYQKTVFNSGMYGEYNTIGNNYSARINRIVIDRPLMEQEIFTQPYSFVMKTPDMVHFTNTLSPLTNLTYNTCGDSQNGEDHIQGKFAINAGKRIGMGFDLDYHYARGYYQRQSTSHFGATVYGSYRGDRYNLHAIFAHYHQKATENGGITNDEYITHPEAFDAINEDELPTVLNQNWNRDDNTHFFLTHRYNLGFYRKVKMTDAEIKARQFAREAMKDKKNREKQEEREDGDESDDKKRSGYRRRGKDVNEEQTAPAGRPRGARIAGDEPVANQKQEISADSTRVLIENQQKLDSLLAEERRQDSINATMKDEYVPVTSFIHTFDLNSYDRIYQAYVSPEGLYKNQYYNGLSYRPIDNDDIFDEDRTFLMKNTVGIALLEGFNKWMKAGLKIFATHEYRSFKMPTVNPDFTASLGKFTEHGISIGGQINKTLGKAFHYNLMAETWLVGEDIGQLKIDFNTDFNFKLWGDTLTLAAKAYFYRLNPTFYYRSYHSKHFWWDNDLSKETRMRIEGLFRYRKTRTSLRVAIEEIQKYTYFTMNCDYNVGNYPRSNLTAAVNQASGNINLMTIQLMQDFRLGILNWENIITFQHSNHEDVLPVPAINIWTNLFLKFRIVGQLKVELGADMTYFTKYYAPDFLPQLNQFAIQENETARKKIGGYPWVNVYANFHLKHARFFVMMSHVNAGGSKEYFLTPNYPTNTRVLRFGISWNFFN